MSNAYISDGLSKLLPSHKVDENWFWNEMREVHQLNKSRQDNGDWHTPNVTARDIINRADFPMHHKRAWGILDKWVSNGLYDYGVTLDLGWITPYGLDFLPRTYFK